MLDLSGLPRIARPDMAIINRALSLRPAITGRVENALVQSLPYALSPTSDLATAEADKVLRIATTRGEMRVACTLSQIDALSDAMIPGWRDEAPDALPVSWRVIFLVDVLLRGTPLANEPLDIALLPVESGLFQSRINMVLALPQTEIVFTVAFDIQDPDGVLDWLPAHHDTPPPLHDVNVVVRPVASVRRLPLSRLEDLGLGDVVLLAGAQAGAIPARLTLAGRGPLGGHVGPDGRFSLSNSPERMFQMLDTEEATKPTAPVTGSAPGADPAAVAEAFRDLPVDISITFGATSIPLSALSDLTDGSVLDLGIDLNAPVDIVANGQKFASGRLIQIGPSVGVQLERIGGE